MKMIVLNQLVRTDLYFISVLLGYFLIICFLSKRYNFIHGIISAILISFIMCLTVQYLNLSQSFAVGFVRVTLQLNELILMPLSTLISRLCGGEIAKGIHFIFSDSSDKKVILIVTCIILFVFQVIASILRYRRKKRVKVLKTRILRRARHMDSLYRMAAKLDKEESMQTRY